MYTLFVILMCIVAVLMILIVLIQESKGGGLSSSFSNYNQIAGVRKTTDFVEKMTWTFAGLLVVLSIACAYVAPQATSDTSVMDNIQVEMPATMQGMPGSDINAVAPEAPAAEAPAAPAPEAPAQQPE